MLSCVDNTELIELNVTPTPLANLKKRSSVAIYDPSRVKIVKVEPLTCNLMDAKFMLRKLFISQYDDDNIVVGYALKSASSYYIDPFRFNAMDESHLMFEYCRFKWPEYESFVEYNSVYDFKDGMIVPRQFPSKIFKDKYDEDQTIEGHFTWSTIVINAFTPKNSKKLRVSAESPDGSVLLYMKNFVVERNESSPQNKIIVNYTVKVTMPEEMLTKAPAFTLDLETGLGEKIQLAGRNPIIHYITERGVKEDGPSAGTYRHGMFRVTNMTINTDPITGENTAYLRAAFLALLV